MLAVQETRNEIIISMRFTSSRCRVSVRPRKYYIMEQCVRKEWTFKAFQGFLIPKWADLHIWSGAWSVQHGNCSTWRGCAYYLFPAEWCNFAGYGIFD